MEIADLLTFAVKNRASDLHLSSGLPPMIRVHGDVRRNNVPAMDNMQVRAMIYDIMSDARRKGYEEFLEIDFSFELPVSVQPDHPPSIISLQLLSMPSHNSGASGYTAGSVSSQSSPNSAQKYHHLDRCSLSLQ